MTLPLLLVFALGFGIAYANGGNDVSKGIATLVGSGVTNYRRAIAWGTLWTGAGAVAGAFLARAMVQTFGKGMLSANTHSTMVAAVASIAGAALWVALATRKGLPVSTTHAIVGSVTGVAVAAYGISGVNWMGFSGKVILPLLLSPAISLGLTLVVLKTWSVLSPAATDCVCIEVEDPLTVGNGSLALVSATPQLAVRTCESSSRTGAGITVNHFHWFTSGATSLARGLNDTPKMVALIMGSVPFTGDGFNLSLVYFAAIAGGIMAGSWIAGQRVTEVLSSKVTFMDHREGFVANLVTAALVGPGAVLGLPMSTTHVASGAIFGVATRQGGGANRKVIWEMLLAWVATVPGAAALGVASLFVARGFGVQ